MLRRIGPSALALLIVVGCAGPSKLAEKSEVQLEHGEAGHAWQLAIRALDKDPGNQRARAAATAAGNALARDWEQRIAALATSDSMAAAEQVLELATFRSNAARYAAITVSPTWTHTEQALRLNAARVNYQHAVADLGSKRPKRAYLGFMEAQRFVPDYRDAARLADQAYARGVTRVAVFPFASPSNVALGRDVAAGWRDDLAQRLVPPDAPFTRVLGMPAVEQQMTVSQLGSLSRDDAIRLARKAGAERAVWGSVGNVDAQTKLHVFADVIAHRITVRDAEGHDVTQWVDLPIEVISRERTVTVAVDYEVIATASGATLAHQRVPRTSMARVVWTSYTPEGDLDAYALVSDAVRSAHPDRAKDVETRWKDACGENTTLRQVLDARRSTHSSGHYDRDALPRFIAGAAFVFLQELPPAEDLAFAALSGGWHNLGDDLAKLDGMDDVDLGLAMVKDDAR